MKRQRLLAVALVALFPFVAGCSVVNGLQTRVSTAQTCESAAEILADMSELTLLLVTNPFGFESYSAELKLLSAELDQLNPRDPELDGALDGLAEEISVLLDALEDEALSVEQAAGSIAQAQLRFRDIANLCRPFRE